MTPLEEFKSIVAQCKSMHIEQALGMGIEIEYKLDTKTLHLRAVPQDNIIDDWIFNSKDDDV